MAVIQRFPPVNQSARTASSRCLALEINISSKRTPQNVGDFLKNVGVFRKNVGDFLKNVGVFRKNVGDFSKNVGDFFKNVGDFHHNHLRTLSKGEKEGGSTR